MEDSSMSELNILHLPDHVIGRILDFVDDRFVVSSVCRRFYQIDCFVTRKKLKMKINEEAVGDESIVASILSSERICRTIDIDLRNSYKEDNSSLIEKVFQKHGESVTNLRFSLRKSYDESDLVALLNFLPNLEALKFLSSASVVDEEYLQKCLEEFVGLVEMYPDNEYAIRRIQTISADFEERAEKRLPRLKKLFLSSDRESLIFFTRYVERDTLEEVEIFLGSEEKKFRQFVEKQTKIKHFTGTMYSKHFEQLDGLQLESLDLHKSYAIELLPQEELNFAKFLKSQENLKTLKLFPGTYIREHLFQTICKLKTLKNLKMRIDSVPHALLRNLADLENLENFEVSMATGTRREGDVLSEIRFPKLKYLEIYHEYRIKDETRRRLEESFSEIELKFDYVPC